MCTICDACPALTTLCMACRVKQDLYAALSAKQSALQLLQEREQQLSAVSTTANTCKQQLEQLQRCASWPTKSYVGAYCRLQSGC
jgi:hypothetical protein